jgi:Transcriptional regulator, AbiEi antitoxin/Protein of unknown function (DUF559)
MSVASATLEAVIAPTPRPFQRVADIMTTAELLAAGWSADQIQARVRRGDLLRLGRGVYASAARARELMTKAGGDELLKIAAAAAVTGPDAVVSHQSAAALHRIDLLGRTYPLVALTRPAGRGWHGRPGIRLHAAPLPPEHVTAEVGMLLTTPARTVIDLARVLDFRGGVIAADSALRRKLTSREELRAVLAAVPLRSGVSRAAEVVEFADGLAESPLESIARVAFRDGGLAPPALQVWLGGTTEPAARVDFYWRKYRTIAEADGNIKYNDPLRASAQLRRDSVLRADGFEIVHFGWQEITENPAFVMSSIKTAFRRSMIMSAHDGAAG